MRLYYVLRPPLWDTPSFKVFICTPYQGILLRISACSLCYHRRLSTSYFCKVLRFISPSPRRRIQNALPLTQDLDLPFRPPTPGSESPIFLLLLGHMVIPYFPAVVIPPQPNRLLLVFLCTAPRTGTASLQPSELDAFSSILPHHVTNPLPLKS